MESGLLTCVKCKSPPERSHRLLLLPGRNCLFFTCLCKSCKTGTRSRTIQIIINFDLVYKQVSSPLPSFLSLLSLPSLLSLLCSQVYTAHPLSCFQTASVTMNLPYFFSLNRNTNLIMIFINLPTLTGCSGGGSLGTRRPSKASPRKWSR